MRQQAGFAQYQCRRRFQIGQCRLGAECPQGVARSGVAQLRLVAEREKGFLAAGGLTGAGNFEDGIGREVVRLALARRPRESAVVADVPTQPREGDEDLLGEAHRIAMAGEAKVFRQSRKTGKVIAGRQRYGLGVRQRTTRCRRGESTCHFARDAHCRSIAICRAPRKS
jgi:hypothetical protein